MHKPLPDTVKARVNGFPHTLAADHLAEQLVNAAWRGVFPHELPEIQIISMQ